MRLKVFHLIPAILLFFCFACQNAKNTPQESIKNENFQEDNSFFPLQNKPSAPFSSDFWEVKDTDVSDIDYSRKLIAFTFDDAPSRTIENLYALFAAYNEENPDCKATATVFFNSCKFDKQTPHLLHTAYTLGWELGNHTHSHTDLTKLTREEIQAEIDRADYYLQKIDGKERHLLRAPFGRLNDEVKAVAKVPIIDWTIDTLDWTKASAEEIYNSVWEGRFSGAIVLMHDGYKHTVSALKRLLPDLKADGYQAVTLSQMIKAHGCRFRNGSVYIRARKQN